MSRVLTFSLTYPSYHQRSGEPTYFVEKIWNSLYGSFGLHVDYKMICDLNPKLSPDILWQFWISIDRSIEDLKHHTCRAKHHFKIGDWFSPRVWSGVPYKSKQIIIGPDIQVKKILDFEITVSKKKYVLLLNHKQMTADMVGILAHNDGLSFVDFMDWFKYPGTPFDGQIICWSDEINY